jgi:SAM domain (Sterile alpha motif)
MDIVVWLRSLGLGKYEATFRDNAIDDTVLPDLTDQDLEKLGVPRTTSPCSRTASSMNLERLRIRV